MKYVIEDAANQVEAIKRLQFYTMKDLCYGLGVYGSAIIGRLQRMECPSAGLARGMLNDLAGVLGAACIEYAQQVEKSN